MTVYRDYHQEVYLVSTIAWRGARLASLNAWEFNAVYKESIPAGAARGEHQAARAKKRSIDTRKALIPHLSSSRSRGLRSRLLEKVPEKLHIQSPFKRGDLRDQVPIYRQRPLKYHSAADARQKLRPPNKRQPCFFTFPSPRPPAPHPSAS
jgi:hypothetical protein